MRRFFFPGRPRQLGRDGFWDVPVWCIYAVLVIKILLWSTFLTVGAFYLITGQRLFG